MTDEMFDDLAASQTASEVTSAIDAYSKSQVISGNASSTSFDISHSFATFKVQVEVLDYGNAGSGATYATVYTDVTRPTNGKVTVAFAVAPSATQDYLVLLTKVTG